MTHYFAFSRLVTLQLGRAKIVTAAFGLCLAPSLTYAQSDFTIPDAPAFTYLGASPTAISRPTTARDLALAFGDGIDSLGRVRRGLALDYAPWLLLPKRVTNAGYRSSLWDFVYANTQMSIGSVQTAGDTSSTDIAVGIKTNLLNGADPLLDEGLGKRIDSAVTKCQALKDADGRPLADAIENCSSKAAERLTSDWLDSDGHWNDAGFSVAAAFGVRLTNSELERARGRGGALWTTLALPLGSSFGQVLLHGRADWIRGISSDTTSVTAGGKLVFGGARLNGFAEWLGSWRNKGANESSRHWSAGLEFRASETLWLSTGFGTAYNDRVKADRTILLANLRWNVASAPFLEPR